MNQIKIMKKGFTLIEVIIALVVLAIMAAMMTSYFDASLIQSGTPISKLNTSMSLNMVMENITAEFNNRFQHWRSNTIYAANAIILPSTTNQNGFLYRTTTGGTSANCPPCEPAWPLPNITNRSGTSVKCSTTLPDTACTVTDGGVTWHLYAATLSPALSQFKTDIGAEDTDVTFTFNNVSCSYRVIQNRFIKFDATNTEVNINSIPTDPAYGRYLKVTIGQASTNPNTTAETITSLFISGN